MLRTRKLILDPRPMFGVNHNGSTQYAFNSSPVNCNLNGAEMITNSNDRDFEVNVGTWVGNGTHTIARSTLQAHSGSASGLITATGVGDATTNFVDFPATSYSTIVAGQKFTKEFWARSLVAGTKVTFRIGTKSVQSAALSTSAWTKTVLNFLATASEVGQPLQAYLSAIDGVYIDDISLTQAYDVMLLSIVKASTDIATGRSVICVEDAPITSFYNVAIAQTTGCLRSNIKDGTTLCDGASTAPAFNDNRYHCIAVTFQRDGNTTRYLDGRLTTSPTTDISAVGKVAGLTLGLVGWNGVIAYWSGNVCPSQIIRFPALPSNIAQKIYEISTRWKRNGLPSSHAGGQLVFHHDPRVPWRDLSGNGNNLTPVGSPQIIKARF